MWIVAVCMLASPPAEASEGHHTSEPGYFWEVLRASREVYLDPSDTNRRAVTERIIERVFKPLETLDEARKWENRTYFQDIVHSTASFADETLLLPELKRQLERYNGFDQKELYPEPEPWQRGDRERLQQTLRTAIWTIEQRPRTSLLNGAFQKLLPAAREICFPRGHVPRADEEWPDACNDALLGALVHSGDPRTRASDDPSIKAWLNLFKRYHERRTRLSAALALPVIDNGENEDPRAGVRNLAFEETIGASDPRTWDPADVALIIQKAREEDGQVPSSEREHGDPCRGHNDVGGGYVDEGGHPHGCTGDLGPHPRTPTQRLLGYLDKLLPMGLSSALTLIEPRNRWLLDLVAKDSQHPDFEHWEHFPFEVVLYDHEWALQHANDRTPPLPLYDVTIGRGDEVVRYQQARWVETDGEAPHPDLDEVRSALRKIERTKKR